MNKTNNCGLTIKIIAKNFGLALTLIVSSFAMADAPLQLESLSNRKERTAVYKVTVELFHKPVRTADQFLSDLARLPENGWQSQWLTELKALDLAAYIVDVEEAMYFASAGKWKPPEHIYQSAHIEFYKTRINPAATLYSYGVADQTLSKFLEKFMTKLLLHAGSKELSLLKVLLQTKRELWFYMVVQYGFKNPAVKTQVLQELIEAIPAFNGGGGNHLSFLVNSILSRPSKIEQSLLMRSVYSQMLIKNDPAILYRLPNQPNCDALLSIDTEFSKLPGQQSRIKEIK